MSWSIGYSGSLEDAKRELRKQVSDNDSYCGCPGGMSTEENLLRRQACTLALSALEAQRPGGDSYLANMTQVRVSAYGSETRDSHGHFVNSVSVSVDMTSAPEPGAS